MSKERLPITLDFIKDKEAARRLIERLNIIASSVEKIENRLSSIEARLTAAGIP